MKILLDAQLPRSLAKQLESMGCDVLHTFDLAEGNRSSDRTIASIADRNQRVVFSKDADFLQSHLLRGSPARLLIVSIGNINNKGLSALLLKVLPELIKLSSSDADRSRIPIAWFTCYAEAWRLRSRSTDGGPAAAPGCRCH